MDENNSVPRSMGSTHRLTDHSTLIIGDGTITTWALYITEWQRIASIQSDDGSPLRFMPDTVEVLDDGYIRINPALEAGYQVLVRYEDVEE